VITGHRYDSGPINTHGPCIALVAASGGMFTGTEECGAPENEHTRSEYFETTPSVELDWQTLHEDLIESVMRVMPESWGGDESPEFIVTRFVEEITRRLTALGGSLERWPEDEEK
jgi:hypothetical protein